MATSLAAAAATTHTATEQLQEDGWAVHQTTKGMEKKWRHGEREGKKLNAAELRNYMATEAPRVSSLATRDAARRHSTAHLWRRRALSVKHWRQEMTAYSVDL